MRHRRLWAPLLVGGAALAALLFALVPAASSTAGDEYGTHISPATQVAGTSGPASTYTLTIKNVASTTDTIGAIQVTLPSGYGDVVSATAGDWTTDPLSGRVATLRNSAGLAVGDSVDISVQADTPKQAIPYVWQTHADSNPDFDFTTGSGDFTSQGDPEVTVTHGPLARFDIAEISEQTAGIGFSVTAIAADQYHNPLGSDYSGTPALSGTLLGSPRGCPGAGSACVVNYQNPPSVSNGVASWSGVKGYGAQTGATVTATDGGASGTSDPFDVKHNTLDHFTLGSVSSPQTAGVGFAVSATAEDAFENPLGSDYSGTPALSGTLLGSPRGCPGAGSACVVNYQNPPSVSNGVASWSGVKGYGAQTGATVTATDGGASGTSDPFDVKHNTLDHFTLGSVSSPQTAGVGFTVKATAEDNFENPLGNDYSGGATLSGTLTNSNRGCGTNNTSQCLPTYGNPASWSNGIGTWTVIGYNAESGRTVTAKDSSITGSSNTFRVQPADPALLTFTQQPNDTQPNPPACTGSAVCQIATKVQDLDFYGNAEVGVPVNVQIDPFNNPGIDTLTALTAGECSSGVCTQNADSNGVATFTDLTLHNVAINYKLKATSGPTVSPPGPPTASTTSSFFNVANTVTKCQGNCTANAQDPGANITATATGVSATGNLSIALESKKVTNSTACVITNQVGDLVTVNPSGPVSGSTLEVTGTLLHTNNKGGVGNLIFCKNTGPNTGFHAVGLCSQTKPKNSPPCLKKLSGNGQGDIFFDLIAAAIPDPNNPGGFVFDPSMGGGT